MRVIATLLLLSTICFGKGQVTRENISEKIRSIRGIYLEALKEQSRFNDLFFLVTGDNVLPGMGLDFTRIYYHYRLEQQIDPDGIRKRAFYQLYLVVVEYALDGLIMHSDYTYNRSGELMFHFFRLRDETRNNTRSFYFWKERGFRIAQYTDGMIQDHYLEKLTKKDQKAFQKVLRQSREHQLMFRQIVAANRFPKIAFSLLPKGERNCYTPGKHKLVITRQKRRREIQVCDQNGVKIDPALVYIDQEFRGETPLKLKLKPGSYQLLIQKRGY